MQICLEPERVRPVGRPLTRQLETIRSTCLYSLSLLGAARSLALLVINCYIFINQTRCGESGGGGGGVECRLGQFIPTRLIIPIRQSKEAQEFH